MLSLIYKMYSVQSLLFLKYNTYFLIGPPDESPEVPDEVFELLLGDVGVAQLREVPPHVRLGEEQRHSGNGDQLYGNRGS